MTGDTFAPVRSLAVSGVHRRPSRPIARTHRTRLAGGGLGRAARTPRFTTPTTAGRWSLVTRSPSSPSDRLASEIFAQLDRYGVVTRQRPHRERGRWLRHGLPGAQFLEESGQCRRGYFVEGLGAAQFALTGAVDRLRSHQREPSESDAVVLAACDPANPYGAALPWPDREGHRPGPQGGRGCAGRRCSDLLRGTRRQDAAVLHRRSARLAPAAAALARSVQQGLLES